MANPTTYFGWVMPNSADLVTDLPADFNVFGQGVDTSMQDLLGGTTGQVLSKTSATNMDFTWVTPTDQTPLTTKGDLFTFSTVDARLGVGANNTVLTADSSQATGLKWAAGGAGALTLITRNSFSAVASVSIDSIFTSTYFTYLVVIENISASTSTDDLQMLVRAGGTSAVTQYQGSAALMGISAVTLTSPQSGTTSQFSLLADTGTSTVPSNFAIWFNFVGQSSQKPRWHGTGMSDLGAVWLGGQQLTAATYDGILLKSSSSNITGVVSVYGLAKA